jgi:hypothetical protein
VQYLQCKELILRESIRLGGLSREGVLRMVKVELHHNYGSVYDFAVSRCVLGLDHSMHPLIPLCSGWVKRTIDPAFQASNSSATTAETPDAADSLGTTVSSLKIESASAIASSGSAASESGIKVAPQSGAI